MRIFKLYKIERRGERKRSTSNATTTTKREFFIDRHLDKL
jgi:hypothetical protein